MPQLSQDCFASGAADTVGRRCRRRDRRALQSRGRGGDVVALIDADGRVLAHDLIATLQLPPFTNSAVDGYAVRGQDVPSGAARLFRVAGRLQAGSADAGASGSSRRSDSHLHRRAHARRCGHRLHAGGRPRRRSRRRLAAGGSQARSERAAGRRGHRARPGHRACRSLAAPAGRRSLRGDGSHRSSRAQARQGCGVLQRRRDRGARRGASRRASLRLESLHVDRDVAAHRLCRQRSWHSPRRQRRDRAGAQSCRALERSDPELGRGVHRRRRLRQGGSRKRRDAWCFGASQ